MSSSLKRCLSKYVLFFIDIKVNSNSVSWWLSNYWLYVCSISKVYFIYVRILQLIMLLQIICRWDKRIFRCFVYLRYFVWLYLIQIYGNYILSNTKRVICKLISNDVTQIGGYPEKVFNLPYLFQLSYSFNFG